MPIHRSTAVAALGFVLVAATVALTAPVAQAQLGGGTLSITSPGTVALGSAVAAPGGTTVTGQFGNTTVTDNRFTLVAGSWTVTASCTDFTGTAIIPKANASMYSGPATALSGLVFFAPTTVATARSMAGSGGTIASATGVLLSTSVTYRPTMTVTIPTTAPAGSYAATCTQTAV